MENRKHPIEANETLVAVVCSARIQRKYLTESAFFGKAMKIADVLDELSDDEIVTVLRVNTETWAAEDITEYCARQYLYDRDGRGLGVELDDEDGFPAFVRNSKEWALWKDDLEAAAPVQPDPDRRHDERRDHQAMGWVEGASL
ncbi:hypothetical protein [Rhizobium sp. LC145]|uniref:hypothetical protein n=1 Tax=Rhizobium sp. LC145 TaxID=1120688 RepID=UPI00062A1B38|nr:hypothetical protein [Rhizobium sp. LC145]KKX25330.1 hypothetical protein YH62_25640 [Rhizobium sp. LC145]TKT45353.1 hypothetical protein FDR95_25805 [Rhizobiaceae bacterium LC148]